MRPLLWIATILLLAFPLAATDTQVSAPPPCASGTPPGLCTVSRESQKKAREAYKRGRKVENINPEDALAAFAEASALDPYNTEYLTARETLRQTLVQQHVRRGNDLIAQKRTIEASNEFRQALRLDPQNEFAAQRLKDAIAPDLPPRQGWIESEPSRVLPTPTTARRSFHFSDSTRGAFETVARAFGMKATFDEGLPSRRVRVDMDNADFWQALEALNAMSRTYWMPMTDKEFLVAADTSAKHKELDRMMLRTFYLPETGTPQELNDIANIFRTLFEIRFIAQAPNQKTITVRASQPVMEAASRFLERLMAGRPQVMLELQVFEVNQTMLRAIGVQLPLQLQIFNIPASALTALGGQNIQDLVNQLIASGGINQANNTGISALLAQLQNQQNSLFQNPLATFGKGLTLFGVGIPPATANFSLNESRLVSLEHLTMRAAHGDTATFRLGERYPITNGTFAPIFNSPQIGQILGANSFVAPFPSINYEDLGLTVKAKPAIHAGNDVTLDLEMEIKSLGAQAFNGIPVINNRNFKSTITVKNDETAVIAGMLTRNESRTLAGMPGFGHIPVIGRAVANGSTEHDRSELLIVITPHVVSERPTTDPSYIPLRRE